MKVAILTRPANAAPKVLAESLQCMLNELKIENEIYGIDFLRRLDPFWKKSNFGRDFFSVMHERLSFFSAGRKMLKRLKKYDMVVISESCPTCFNDYYNVEQFKRKLKKPVALIEVYYLKNTPWQRDRLIKAKQATEELYDWHFSVSDVTEIRSEPSLDAKWTKVGLKISDTVLDFNNKGKFVALVDFPQSGYEEFRAAQLRVLEKNKIKYIELSGDGSYSLDEIRGIYNNCAVYFMQSPEAFGLPLAEAMAAGAKIFTADSSWPISWRLGLDLNTKNPTNEYLPSVFEVYSNEADLESKLLKFKEDWDAGFTPQNIHNDFVSCYPHLYHGDSQALKNAVEHLCLKR